MLLAAVSDILGNLGFDAMTDISFAVTQALDAAEEQLAAMLNTEFAAATHTDVFYVRQPPYQDGSGFQTQFRLRQGFVTAPLTSIQCNPNVSMLTGQASQLGSWPPVLNTPSGGANIDVSASVFLDAEKGMVSDFTNRYARQYVMVVYSAGFAADPSTPGSYLISTVPDWLQQAAKLCAMLALADSPSLSEAQIKIDKQLVGMQYTALMSRKARYFPNALLPI